jgi:hypothetical protein
MAWKGQADTEGGKRYAVGERCPEDNCGGTIQCESGGGFGDHLTVRCNECGVRKTGYSIGLLF